MVPHFSNVTEENKMRMEADSFLCDVRERLRAGVDVKGGGRYMKENWGLRRWKGIEIFVLENELTKEIH